MKKFLLTLVGLCLAANLYAADSEVQDLTDITAPAVGDDMYIVDDPDGTPASKKISIGALLGVSPALDADGTITDDYIDSDDYAGGSIDAEHLAADIIDETKIADNGIDSEHYNDGSIDPAHLNISNAETDEYALTYEADTSNFQWVQLTDNNTQNTLDEAYDEGGAGAGRTITVDTGAVALTTGANNQALTVTGTGNTTEHVMKILDGASITGASLLHITGSDSDANTRELVKIIQDHASATGAIGLGIRNDSIAAGEKIDAQGNGPHLYLTGDPTVAAPVDGYLWYTGASLNFYDGTSTTDLLGSSAGDMTKAVYDVDADDKADTAEDLIAASSVVSDAEVDNDITLTNISQVADVSVNGASLVTAANYAAMRGLLDLEAGTDFYAIAAADTAFEAELDNSAGLLAALSDETGTGVAVFSTSPTLVTPVLGTITSGVGTTLTALNGENIQDDTIDDDSIDFADVTGADLTLTDCGAITSTGLVDLGGADLELPNTAGDVAPDSVGEIEFDSVENELVVFDGTQEAAIPTIFSKDILLVEPDQIQTVTDNVRMFCVDSYNYPNGITITAIRMDTDIADTVTVNFEEWDQSAVSGATIATIDSVTLTNATEVTETTITDASIASGAYIMLDLDTSNVNTLGATIWYRVEED